MSSRARGGVMHFAQNLRRLRKRQIIAAGWLAAASTASMIHTASATVFVYSGTTTGVLNTTTNWTPNGTPSSLAASSDTAQFGPSASNLSLTFTVANFGGPAGT